MNFRLSRQMTKLVAVQLSQKSIGFAYADDPMTLTGTALELESWKERMVEV
jgi:hypothetical protein